MTQPDKTPKWLDLTLERATIQLSVPAMVNDVRVDSLTMRSPTVKDQLDCRQVAGDDDARYELQMFCSLTEVRNKDLEALQTRDYRRLQAAFLRLEDMDGL